MRLLCILFVSMGLIACSSKGGDGAAAPAKGAKAAPAKGAKAAPAKAAPAKAAAGPAAEAKTIFDTRCATCHGKTGKGDGVAAANLPVKPTSYADAAWQASVKDDFLAKIIVEGGGAVGKSPLMAANPDLKAKPEVVKELVKLVRSFKQ